jgi:putative hemolysin
MTAESVMTPRVNVEFLSRDMMVDEACDFFMQASHSRIPVYGENNDDVEFVLTFRETFKLQREGHGKAKLSSLDLEKIMRVPVTQSLDDLFEKFQKSRRHIALVVDEHGGTAGVITMEDVLEEVFGDIKDEKDREEIYMKKKRDGSIEAIGTVLIDDILEEWNVHAEDINLPEEYQGEPLSYIVLAEKAEFPDVGTVITFGKELQVTLEVAGLEDGRIEKILCKCIKKPL